MIVMSKRQPDMMMSSMNRMMQTFTFSPKSKLGMAIGIHKMSSQGSRNILRKGSRIMILSFIVSIGIILFNLAMDFDDSFWSISEEMMLLTPIMEMAEMPNRKLKLSVQGKKFSTLPKSPVHPIPDLTYHNDYPSDSENLKRLLKVYAEFESQSFEVSTTDQEFENLLVADSKSTLESSRQLSAEFQSKSALESKRHLSAESNTQQSRSQQSAESKAQLSADSKGQQSADASVTLTPIGDIPDPPKNIAYIE